MLADASKGDARRFQVHLMAGGIAAMVEIQRSGAERSRTDRIVRQTAELHILQRERRIDVALP